MLSSHPCRYVDSVANASRATSSAAPDAMTNSTSTSNTPLERRAATMRSANGGTAATAPTPEHFYTEPRVRAAYKLWVRGVIRRVYSCHATCTLVAWHGLRIGMRYSQLSLQCPS